MKPLFPPGGTWGPFIPGLNPSERRCRLRCLRLAARFLCGPRSLALRTALIAAEIDPAPDVLAEVEAEFDRLGTVNRRRVLSAFRETV